MEFEEQIHSPEHGVFSRPSALGGRDTAQDSHKDTSTLFSHISQQHEAQYSPLHQVTTKIHELYQRCNPAFSQFRSSIPARLLTQPSEPLSDAVPYDNKEGNLIARVYDQINVPGADYHYTIMDLLGTGTFGQVFRCLKEFDEIEGSASARRLPSQVVAVKVVKGKPAYRTQGLLEVKIAKTVNRLGDPEDKHNIVRVLDSFEDRGHVCIVFELLSCSLLDVLTQNQYRGLPLEVVQHFTAQLLSALGVLQDTNIIHCDLKPENILICPKNCNSNSKTSSKQFSGDEDIEPLISKPHKNMVDLKVIDFGSACFEGKTMYSYIQSRFYRSPEVLLGVPYNGAIDMWSLGCVCAEVYLGLPLFPGASQHNQLTRIVDMLGDIPEFLIEHGKNRKKFFNVLKHHSPRNATSIMPIPLQLPPPLSQNAKIGKGSGAIKSSSSLGSILPSALVDGGVQVSSFMNTLVTGGVNRGHAASGDKVSTPGKNKANDDNSRMIDQGHAASTSRKYRLKSAEEYAADNNQQVPTFRKYLRYDKLDDIIMKCPLPSGTSGQMNNDQKKKEHYRRKCFLDFLKGVLNLNPFDRLTAHQAMEHPFVAKFFDKKSNIGTIKVKARSSKAQSPSGSRSNRRVDDSGAQPEYVEKRIFLPPFDEKVHSRVTSYQQKMEEILNFKILPSHLMSRHNVYLSKKKSELQLSATRNGNEPCVKHYKKSSSLNSRDRDTDPSLNSILKKTSAMFIEAEKNIPVHNSTPLAFKESQPHAKGIRSTNQETHFKSETSTQPMLNSIECKSNSTTDNNSSDIKNSRNEGVGISPGGLISALLQVDCEPQNQGIRDFHSDQQVPLPQHQSPYSLQYGYTLPPNPPTSLASSFDSSQNGGVMGDGGSYNMSHGPSLVTRSHQLSATLPIPMPESSSVSNDVLNVKLSGSPHYDTGCRKHNSSSGMSRSWGRTGSGVTMFGGCNFSDSLSSSLGSNVLSSNDNIDLGNFSSGPSASSSFSSNPPSFPSSNAATPSQQFLLQFPSQSGFTPTNSYNMSTGAHMFDSPSSSNDQSNVLQRPELDENRYLQSFGFQFHQQTQQSPQSQPSTVHGRAMYGRSKSINETTFRYKPSFIAGDYSMHGNSSGVSGHSNSMTSCGNSVTAASIATGLPLHQNYQPSGSAIPSIDSTSWPNPPHEIDNYGNIPVASALATSCSGAIIDSDNPSFRNNSQQQQISANQWQPVSTEVEATQCRSNHNNRQSEGLEQHSLQIRKNAAPDSGSDDDEPLFECED